MLAHNLELIDVADRKGNTALHLAAGWDCPDVVACLLAHGAVGFEPMFFLEHLPLDRVAKVMLAHNPELARRADLSRSTLLHRVFGLQGEEKDELFSEDLMRTVWQMNPEAVHATNFDEKTPFDIAVENENQFAIDLVKWQLCFDEISRYRELVPPSLLDQIWESLSEALHKDLVESVYAYLGDWQPNKKNKRKRDERGEEREEKLHNTADSW